MGKQVKDLNAEDESSAFAAIESTSAIASLSFLECLLNRIAP